MAADIKKRRKITTDLDSTASASQILDELPHRNKEAFMFYCRNMLQTKTVGYHCYLPGYPLNTFGDDWNGQLLPNYFQSSTYKSLPPKIITGLRHQDKTDPVSDYLYLKKKWWDSMVTAKKNASRLKAEEKLECLNEEVIRCPKSIITIANLMDQDPDQYFNCRYNWYYAGLGNLHVISYDGNEYLLTSEFSTVCLKLFTKNMVDDRSEPITSFDCESHNVLEIAHSPENVLAFRTRNKVFLSRLITENDQIQIKKITTLDSDIPYTGISFDNYHPKVLNVTLLDKNLYIINIETMLGKKIQLKGKSTSLVDNWNRVLGGRSGYYLHVTKKAICVYDKRSNGLVNAYTVVRHAVDEHGCNDISAARQLGAGDYAYFATTHHLFELDLRFFKSFRLECTSRWTHGMRFPPLYIDATGLDAARDLVCLAGPRAEDACVLPNWRKSGFAYDSAGGATMPYRPPGAAAALREAAGPTAPDAMRAAEARLGASVTGLALLGRATGADLLLHSSLGDITWHALRSPAAAVDADESASALRRWGEEFVTERKPIEVSEVVNVSKCWRRLRRVAGGEQLLTDTGRQAEREREAEREVAECFARQEVDVELREAWGAPPRAAFDYETLSDVKDSL